MIVSIQTTNVLLIFLLVEALIDKVMSLVEGVLEICPSHARNKEMKFRRSIHLDSLATRTFYKKAKNSSSQELGLILLLQSKSFAVNFHL